MKIIQTSLLIVVFSLVCVPILLAQKTKSSAVKINMLTPVFRTASLFMERKIGRTTSAQLGIGMTNYKVGDNEINLNGYALTPEFRFYLSGRDALDGLYVAPFYRRLSYDLTMNYDNSLADSVIIGNGKFTSNGIGLEIGGQKILRNFLSLEVFLGTSYNLSAFTLSPDSKGRYFDKVTRKFMQLGFLKTFGVRMGITVGIVF